MSSGEPGDFLSEANTLQHLFQYTVFTNRISLKYFYFPVMCSCTIFPAGTMQQLMQLCCAVALGAAAACGGPGLKQLDYFPVPVHSTAKQTIVPGELAENRWLISPLLLLHDRNLPLFPSTHRPWPSIVFAVGESPFCSCPEQFEDHGVRCLLETPSILAFIAVAERLFPKLVGKPVVWKAGCDCGTATTGSSESFLPVP